MTRNWVGRVLAGRCAAMVMLCTIAPFGWNVAEAAQFEKLMGTWKGGGTASFEGDRKERLKCNAYYTGGGSQMNLAVRCASVSYKIEIRSKLEYSGGEVVGTWEERTFNAAGETKGTINDERLELAVEGGGLTATMTIDFSSPNQKLEIQAKGVKLQSVSIDLARHSDKSNYTKASKF